MAVMPAGMHLPLHPAAERNVRLFMDGEGVHIRAQSDTRALPRAEGGHDAGLRHRKAVGDTQFVQLLPHQAAGLVKVVAQLRVLVQLTPDRHHPVLRRPGRCEQFCFVHYALSFWVARE